MTFVFFLALALLVITLRIIFTKSPRNFRTILEITLITLVVVFIGLSSLMAGVAHIFASDQIAPQIGWKPSPFEYEVGVANLAVGTLGVLCLWFRKEMLLAAVTAGSIWMFGDMGVHIYDLTVNNNTAPMNAGFFIWLSNALFLLILIMYIAYRLTDRRQQNSS